MCVSGVVFVSGFGDERLACDLRAKAGHAHLDGDDESGKATCDCGDDHAAGTGI